jgi:hypothetical protein
MEPDETMTLDTRQMRCAETYPSLFLSGDRNIEPDTVHPYLDEDPSRTFSDFTTNYHDTGTFIGDATSRVLRHGIGGEISGVLIIRVHYQMSV